jgi:hypothetical protein
MHLLLSVVFRVEVDAVGPATAGVVTVVESVMAIAGGVRVAVGRVDVLVEEVRVTTGGKSDGGRSGQGYCRWRNHHWKSWCDW